MSKPRSTYCIGKGMRCKTHKAMRNLILSSLNTARSRAARLLAHIFTRFPLLKTYN